LVLGADNLVVKQRLLELTRGVEEVLKKPKSILVKGQYFILKLFILIFDIVELCFKDHSI